MTDSLKVGVIGCLGRMGRVITEVILETPGLELVAGSDHPANPGIGAAVAGTHVLVADNAEAVFIEADVVIDFTPPGHTAHHAVLAATTETALVVGTTGLADEDQAALDMAAADTVIVQAGNYSLGVNMMLALVQDAARRLGPAWDIEIVEMHHRHKVDAPSGTALMLGEAAAAGRDTALELVRTPARAGVTGERIPGSIGFASLRGGAVIGEHEVIFASSSERLVISHKAENRRLFAEGAVRAAIWAADQKAGRYGMTDVLGLT